MAFKTYVYESDDANESYRIRIDTDQATISGAVTGATTSGFHVVLSRSRRSFGLHPRFISLTREEGSAQDGTGKIHTTRVAICTPAVYAAIALEQGVQINGVAFKVSGKTPEIKR